MTASPTGSEVHADCVAAVRATAALLRVAGPPGGGGDAAGRRRRLRHPLRQPVGLQQRLGYRRLGEAAGPGGHGGATWSRLSWALVELGRSVDGGQYLGSVQELQRISRQIADYFEGIDVLLTPTLAEPPAPLGTFDSPPGRAADRPLPRRDLRALHPALQRDRPARDLAAAALERGRAADRRAVRRALRRRGDPAVAGRPARAGGPVGRAPAAGRGLGGPGGQLTRTQRVPE